MSEPNVVDVSAKGWPENNLPIIKDIFCLGLGPKRSRESYGCRTEHNKKAILSLVSRGMNMHSAMRACGFTAVEREKWLKEDPDFYEELLQALDMYQQTFFARIETASERDWKAAEWVLKHHPDVKKTFINEDDKGKSIRVTLNFNRLDGSPQKQLPHGITIDSEGEEG